MGKAELTPLVHDPFISHFEDIDETKLCEIIKDIKNKSWSMSTTAIGSSWSLSLKSPSNAPAIKATCLQSTEELSVRCISSDRVCQF